MISFTIPYKHETYAEKRIFYCIFSRAHTVCRKAKMVISIIIPYKHGTYAANRMEKYFDFMNAHTVCACNGFRCNLGFTGACTHCAHITKYVISYA